jgi:peptide chain release factor 3
VQVFRSSAGSDWLVGVVGALQLDVMASRMQAEYGLEVGFDPTSWFTARWVSGDPAKLEKFISANRAAIALDRDENPVFLPRNAWDLDQCQKEWPDLTFSTVRERG